MIDKNKLSNRVRPNSEAAPWVIEEIKLLEISLEESLRNRTIYVQQAKIIENLHSGMIHADIYGNGFISTGALSTLLNRERNNDCAVNNTARLEAEVIKLKAELENELGLYSAWEDTANFYYKQLKTLRVQLAELKSYLHHTGNCTKTKSFKVNADCSCGLRDILEKDNGS